MKLSLQQLSERADVPGRTVRVCYPEGCCQVRRKKGAYYTEAHLADLLRIRQWQDAGLSLDAIASLLQAGERASRGARTPQGDRSALALDSGGRTGTGGRRSERA